MELPELPRPTAVALDPATTAVLALDLTDVQREKVPAAKESIPVVRRLLDRAREHHARVIFSLGRAPQRVVAELARRDDEPIVQSSANKFFRTELERHLEGRTHLVLVGTAANGAVVYTSFAACARGLTVVVAEDAISSQQEIATNVARWQLLNQPGFANAENSPLKTGAVTLSRTDLISFS